MWQAASNQSRETAAGPPLRIAEVLRDPGRYHQKVITIRGFFVNQPELRKICAEEGSYGWGKGQGIWMGSPLANIRPNVPFYDRDQLDSICTILFGAAVQPPESRGCWVETTGFFMYAPRRCGPKRQWDAALLGVSQLRRIPGNVF